MATTATDQDEELLIISDDGDEIGELELTLEEDSSSNDDIINFDEEISLDSVEEISLDNTTELNLSGLKSETTDTELNLDFDLGGDQSEMTVEDMLGDKEAEIKEEVSDVNLESSSDDIFDFGLEEEASEDDSIEEINIKIPSEEISLEDDSQVIEEIALDESSEVDVNFDISLDESNVTEDIIAPAVAVIGGASLIAGDDSSTSGDDDDDVNAILNATIAKLIARKDNINAIKQETTASIDKLNTEIKSLQSEVKTHKADVKELDKETAKIEENVGSLEKMKMK